MAKKKIKTKPKKKKVIKTRTKRRLKLIYRCHRKQVTTRMVVFDEMNEHGAMNDVKKQVPVYELEFTIYHDIGANRNVIPDVFESHIHIATSNEEVFNKFQVGQEYDLAPQFG